MIFFYLQASLDDLHIHQDYCSVCHRTSTVIHQIILAPLAASDAYNGRLMLRHFGDRTGMRDGQQVCNECSFYVAPRSVSAYKASWKDSWPAVVWNCLTKNNYAEPISFMKFLANDLRASWLQSTAH